MRVILTIIPILAWSCGNGGGSALGAGADEAAGGDASMDDRAKGEDAVADAPALPFVVVEEGGRVRVSNGHMTLVYDLATGRFDLGVRPKSDGIIAASSLATLTVDGNYVAISSADDGERAYKVTEGTDVLGDFVMVRFDSAPNGKVGGIATSFSFHKDTPAVSVSSTLVVQEQADVRVLTIQPVVAHGTDGGGLYLGPGTASSVVLDNGSDIVFDFVSDLTLVGERMGIFAGPGFPSNWNAAVCTRDQNCVVAGFVTSDRAFPVVVSDFVEDEALVMDGGERALSMFDMRCIYRPYRALDPDRTLTSEVGFITMTDKPHDALVEYGTTVAKMYGKKVWPSPPASWNSWGGGSGSHGYGSDIDETLILQNLDAAASDYLPYGMDYFLIDDGWQSLDGQWHSRKDRFPDHDGKEGMAWMADRIREKGFIPGVWMAPFRVSVDSDVYKQHPDWMLEMDEIGKAMLGEKERVLDLSHPLAQAWLKDVLHRVFQEWGYRWLKLDFGYYGLLGKKYHAEGKSAMEVYRGGMKLVREAIGEDSFFLNVAALGASMGIADGCRVTLDNEPWWNKPQGMSEQGIKTTLLTSAHRYYLNNTLWTSHPDLLFFRDDYGLTKDEATAWTLFVAIYSGIFKLGESFVFMHEHPDALALTQKFLPTVAAVPEPLDLFELRFPEVWRLRVPGPDKRTHEVYGLFHWGKNRDVGEGKDYDESDRVKVIPADAGQMRVALDFLAGEVLAEGGKALRVGPIGVQMKARTGKIVIVKPVAAGLELPVFLATDRHFLGGVMDAESLDASGGKTTVRLARMVAGRPTRAYFLVPAQGKVEVAGQQVAISGVKEVAFADSRLVEVSFVPEAGGGVLTVQLGGL